MGLLAAIRDLRRRVARTGVVSLLHCRGLPETGAEMTRDNIDGMVREEAAAGRLRVIGRYRFEVNGRWRRFRFPPPDTDSTGG